MGMGMGMGICDCIGVRTDFGGALRAQDVDALDDGSAGVVDAVDEGLQQL